MIFNGETMGTSYTIKIADQTNEQIDYINLKNKIDSILTKINLLFSTHIDNSEINIFNNTISLDPIVVSSDFYYLVSRGKEIYQISNGSFDITVNPLINLWGFNSGRVALSIPDSALIDSVTKHIGSNKLLLKHQSIQKLDSHLKIDLNGIAKGWGVDQISRLLELEELYNYMIEIGGEIKVKGYNHNNHPWNIGIRNPDLNGKVILDTLYITDKAIATSGTYQNYFSYNGTNYSHLINPKTGYPIIHELVSAIIIGNNCTTADAIATSVMVKGFDNGLKWINTLNNVECMLIKKLPNGKLEYGKSNGFTFNFN